MLPAWQPGAHIDLHLPSGRVRQYSLCGDVADRTSYEIAVQLDDSGRGGSREVFAALTAGAAVAISSPRNNFPLRADAVNTIFVAGGIGITPIVPMMRALAERGRAFKLVYCTRAPERTAFLDYALRLARDGLAIVHHDQGRADAQLDLQELLADATPGTHLYYCGPEGLMRAAKAASNHWPSDCVHSEYFTIRPVVRDPDGPFRVGVKNSGLVFDVPPGRSILDVLRDNGIAVDASCESGLCGTCKTRYVAGTPDHRDLVLDDVEQGEFVMICCSRALSETLVLDLGMTGVVHHYPNMTGTDQ